MKSLKDALVDYDLALLQGLAYTRGLASPANRNLESLAAFAEALLSPVSIAIAMDDLSDEERAAVDYVVSVGNLVEARKFTRQYGDIRPMGPGKLQREQPWESPVNVAESLWYRGLIFKGFQHTLNGPEEVIFIPDDLQAGLPVKPEKAPTFQVGLAAMPAKIIEAFYSAREDLFTLLAYIQTHRVELDDDDAIPENDEDAILALMSHAGLADTDMAHHWSAFILQLGRRLDFFRLRGRWLRLNAETVRSWLQKSSQDQIQALQDTWRGDPTWNDLWHIPGLFPKNTGWENSPLLGRSKILKYMSQLPSGEWLSLEAFIRAIKQTEPDFQRPDGDYQSWYIYDANGQPLMEFEHWDAVEGRLISHMVTSTLYGLGVVELGASGDDLPVTSFRLTDLGQRFISPDASASASEPRKPTFLRIDPADFTVRIPIMAALYDRFQLARFAHFVRRDDKRITYQITRERFLKARDQGIATEQIIAFLARTTRGQTPLALVEALRNWDRNTGSVLLEQLTVLRVDRAEKVKELLNHPQIGPLLDHPLGNAVILVPDENVAEVRRLLVEFGYLVQT